MDFNSGVYWDRGYRKRNEDSVLLEKVSLHNGRLILAAVADGIGGLPEGETAGGYLIEGISEILYSRILPVLAEGGGLLKIRRIFIRELHGLCDDLNKYASLKKIRLGSTLSVLIIFNHRFLLIHIGDSAIFKCKRNRIKRITPEHVNADGSLNRCIGSFEFECPYSKLGTIRRNDAFLLCSDGFVRRLPQYFFKRKYLLGESIPLNPKEMKGDAVIEKHLAEICRFLRKQGEGDNISAVYIKAI